MGGKALAVINHDAGGVSQTEKINLLLGWAEENDYEIQIIQSGKNKKAVDFSGLINSFHPNLVFSVGGDGTVSYVLKGLINTEIPFCIIHAGSANGLAKELDIPENAEDAIHLVQAGAQQPIDAVQFESCKYFFHLSDYGFNANIIDKFNREDQRGWFGYFKYFLNEIFHRDVQQYEIEIEGESKSFKAAMVTIANGRKFGTGAYINPIGSINDGKFEICILKPFPASAIPYLTYAFFNQNLHQTEYFQVFSCQKALIRNVSNAAFQYDGEPYNIAQTTTFELIHRPVRVFTPGN